MSEDLSLSESDAEGESPHGKPPQRFAFPPRRLVGSLAGARRRFDFDAFAAVVRTATRNLNRIIDGNYYPVEEARNSNMRHRPVGLGVQASRPPVSAEHAYTRSYTRSYTRRCRQTGSLAARRLASHSCG